jgi:glucose/arabinose dehydrogenase
MRWISAAGIGRRELRTLGIAFGVMLGTAGYPTQSATVPTGYVVTPYVTNLASATAMEFAPDGRLFVCHQNGGLSVIQDGAPVLEPFLIVPTDATGERGLLGIAFDPGFVSNQYLYLYYTATTPYLHNRVSRFTASGNQAVEGSEQIILELEPLSASNHNGGAIHFGPDGMLYVAVGDNARAQAAQSLETRLGKMLRIHPDGSIPASNPFYEIATGDNRSIWSVGLRNPFTFAFDPEPASGRLFINDVGAGLFEEINEGQPGANYGWPGCEGSCATPDSGWIEPLLSYDHALGCAITGGTFYRPRVQNFPVSSLGHYFYADFCGNWIRRLDPETGEDFPFASGIHAPVDLRVGPDGALYCLTRSGVHRITYANEPVSLRIFRSPASSTITLWWPASHAGYLVESTTAIGAGGEWSPVTQLVTESDGYFEMTLDSSGAARFFRLVRP